MQITLNLPNPLAARQSLFTDSGKPLTTSRQVAERFGKPHKNVIRDIKKLLSDIPDPEFSRLNFEPANYLDDQKKPRPEYRLTHDGFALLAMGFTGSNALAWKIAFLQAFNAIEAELHALTERKAAALYAIKPHWLAIEQGTLEGKTNKDIIAITGHRSPNTISRNRKPMRAFGLLPPRNRLA